jgi:nitrous oxidase accessory protein NosD
VIRAAILAAAIAAALACKPAGAAGGPRAAGASACGFSGARRVPVSDAKSLAAALAAARPGDLIVLGRGTYAGRFVAAASGQAAAPIVVCGPRDAVLDGGTVDKGYGLHVTGSYWVFQGFTITRAKKGIVTDGASHNLFADLKVHEIGNEGIRLRAFSSDNVVRGCTVQGTGRTGDPRIGEGIYIGTFHGQWCERSGCGPDRSDRNQIIGNTIGGTTAESIDVKEGTTGGVIRGNVFDGAGIEPPGADSWVDVKGNGYTIEENRGTSSPGDGFQVHAPVAGWGENNRFRANVAKVNGSYGFKIAGGPGNSVGCDNTADGAAKGLANVSCGR